MVKALVTGANGQLGMTLREMAPDYPSIAFDFKPKEDLDITDEDEVDLIFEKEQYDFCINCAAYTKVEQAEITSEIAFKVNAEGVKALALASKRNNTTLIHISTDYVFDGEKRSPYLSDDHPNPINKYGMSKLKGEEYVQEILEDYFIVRTSWLYSKKYDGNFYTTILEKAKKGETIKVTDTQIGCPTNTETLSRYLIEGLLIGKKPFGIHHFTDGKAMTWYDFAERILKENGLEDHVKLEKTKNYHTFVQRPKNSTLN